jgi:hypothetical protein
MPKFLPSLNQSTVMLVTIAALAAIASPTLAVPPKPDAAKPTTTTPSNTTSTGKTATDPTPTDPVSQTAQALYNQMDAAANKRDQTTLLNFYGPQFTTTDGLNRDTLAQSIQHLWQQYPQLTYQTKVLSATKKSSPCSDIDAETLTKVTGKQVRDGRTIVVNIAVRSRQRWQGQKLVQQEILSEQSRLSLGDNPPTVSVNLPETVKVGQSFHYEAVVEEPLDQDILMGELLNQPVTTAALIKPQTLQIEIPSVLELVGSQDFPRPASPPKPNNQLVKLQRLRAGGFFKSDVAPRKPESRWLSAVLVRHDAGITIVTQRLRIVEN